MRFILLFSVGLASACGGSEAGSTSPPPDSGLPQGTDSGACSNSLDAGSSCDASPPPNDGALTPDAAAMIACACLEKTTTAACPDAYATCPAQTAAVMTCYETITGCQNFTPFLPCARQELALLNCLQAACTADGSMTVPPGGACGCSSDCAATTCTCPGGGPNVAVITECTHGHCAMPAYTCTSTEEQSFCAMLAEAGSPG